MNKKAIIAFVTMLAITIYAGAYSSALSRSEIVHFWVAVPAGNVTSPMVARGAGPPINLAPISIDLDRRGVLKNWLSPDIEAISTHWIYNVGKRPVKVQMELVNCSIPVKWEVNANFEYNPDNHTFTQPLMPGQSIPNLGIDWIFQIPAYYMDERVIYDGGLMIKDANTGALLTFIPIKIVRGGGETSGGASCCS